MLVVLNCSIMVHGEQFVATIGTYRTQMWFVASLDTMELYEQLVTQHLDKEQARYGWMTCNVWAMRHQYHTALT